MSDAIRNSMQGVQSPPLFSVIIPCWNAAGTLEQTLRSLLTQTCGNWEAIVVDDGSSDSTVQVALEVAKRDQRFNLLQTRRLGPSAARNLAAFSHANGEFLAFLDSDDLWMPDKLTLSLELLRARPELAGAYGQISFFRRDPRRPETRSTVYGRDLEPLDFLRDNPVCTMSNLVLRRSVFAACQGFDEGIVHNEDVELLVRMATLGHHIGGVNQHLVCYRTSLSGLSSNLSKMRVGWCKALQVLQASPMALTPREVAAADAGNLRYLARRALRTGAPATEALRLALAGACRSPVSFFNPPWRGGMTLLGGLAAPIMPRTIRSFAFSR